MLVRQRQRTYGYDVLLIKSLFPQNPILICFFDFLTPTAIIKIFKKLNSELKFKIKFFGEGNNIILVHLLYYTIIKN